MKSACFPNAKDTENRSKKLCVCGSHSTKAKNGKRKKRRLKGFNLEKFIAEQQDLGPEFQKILNDNFWDLL